MGEPELGAFGPRGAKAKMLAKYAAIIDHLLSPGDPTVVCLGRIFLETH
jgi:hypothetical protein